MIRLARSTDAPALARGMRAIVEEGDYLATQSSTSPDELERRFRKAVEEDHALLIAVDDEEVAGCAGAGPTRVDGVWSLGTWVLRAHRRRGLARAMIERILEPARERGVRKVELEVFTDNEAAQALYRACGFEVEGVRRDHYLREDGTLRSAVVMATFP